MVDALIQMNPYFPHIPVYFDELILTGAKGPRFHENRNIRRYKKVRTRVIQSTFVRIRTATQMDFTETSTCACLDNHLEDASTISYSICLYFLSVLTKLSFLIRRQNV